jgi:hypothetical protein
VAVGKGHALSQAHAAQGLTNRNLLFKTTSVGIQGRSELRWPAIAPC